MILGAFGALASYALFHVVTVFPLAWIMLFSKQSVTEFLAMQIVAAILGTCGVIASGVIADRIGRTKTLGLVCRADRHLQRLLTDASCTAALWDRTCSS